MVFFFITDEDDLPLIFHGCSVLMLHTYLVVKQIILYTCILCGILNCILNAFQIKCCSSMPME
jgi:hypothetical protein